MRKQAIGFLDSGVGGFSVVKRVMEKLPNEEVIFIGDSARNPYGNEKKETVIQYSKELSHFLLEKNIKMLVLACNTVTAAALDLLKAELDIPVIGVIEPGSKSAVSKTRNNQIGVIGTVRTIHSSEHQKIIKKLNPHAKVHTLAVPKFVELVENNELTSNYAKGIIKDELKELKKTGMDTLVLACTHYPLLEDSIKDYLGEAICLIDPAIATVELIQDYLEKNDLLNENNGNLNDSTFYTTGNLEKFEEVARQWIPNEQFKVEHINVEELSK